MKVDGEGRRRGLFFDVSSPISCARLVGLVGMVVALGTWSWKAGFGVGQLGAHGSYGSYRSGAD